MEEKNTKLSKRQKDMLRRRNVNPNDYEFVKETYCALYVRNIHTGSIKVLNKGC